MNLTRRSFFGFAAGVLGALGLEGPACVASALDRRGPGRGRPIVFREFGIFTDWPLKRLFVEALAGGDRRLLFEGFTGLDGWTRIGFDGGLVIGPGQGLAVRTVREDFLGMRSFEVWNSPDGPFFRKPSTKGLFVYMKYDVDGRHFLVW